ncbi:MAG: methyltransferase domain-containing protein [Pseudomonadota bacterium]
MSNFAFLERATRKPPVFSVYTAKSLWTDDHTSERMLAFHLNDELDVSSRRSAFIDDSVRWMAERFQLGVGSGIVDFGCGPGLYAARFAELGASVTGIDFSARSLAYARTYADQHELSVHYIEGDYLEHPLDGAFDLITMIMCDYCALSPAQRAALLRRFQSLLSDEGRVVLDVYSKNAFDAKQEGAICEKNQLDGFWSAAPYYAIVASHKYEAECVSLDQYTIVEEKRSRVVYNWLQYFTPDSLAQEVRAAGLEVEALHGDVAGSVYEGGSMEFAVVLRKA